MKPPANSGKKNSQCCAKSSLMQLLFILSFLGSLFHIGRHLLFAEDFFSNEDTFTTDTPRPQRRTSNSNSTATNTNTNDTANTLPDPTTWALVTPQGLIGGYRNQVIRLFGMVIGASQQKVRQFLYPSLLWTTTNRQNQMRTIPMEDLFDIEYWNTFQDKFLPKLVENIHNADCWYPNLETMLQEHSNLTQTLRQRPDAPLQERILQKPRFVTPIANISLAYATGELALNPRRFELPKQVESCTHPIAYGVGGGRGVLWFNYMEYNRKRRKNSTTGFVQPDPLEQVFLQALRPLPKWRSLAQQCIFNATQQQQQGQPKTQIPKYIALHPRIELEMMAHSCGAYMNKNLTRIFQDVQQFVQERQEDVAGIFVALSRAGASVTEGNPYRRFRANVDENIRTLNRVLGNPTSKAEGLFLASGHNIPVFECGDKLVQHYYDSQTEQPTIDYGSLLPSILNFDIAVEATIFIGMRFSSWSNSVWTTRYYLGRGNANFEYTRERGIQPIENGGLPPPHQNCDGIRDPGR